MRTLAVLAFLTGFVAAVILPNEIGTHGLPAIGGKVVTKAHQKTVKPPAKGGPVACLASVWPQSEAAFGLCEAKVWRSPRTASNQQLNLPLLI
jgi:hypothetical protein